MNVAILGGGVAGLTAACYSAKKGHNVTLFEKSAVLGGLAAGFKAPHWHWSLEKTYHHLFTSDTDILDLATEIGFRGIFFKTPRTASLYEVKTGENSTVQQYPFSTPLDLMRFPLLSFTDKTRMAAMMAFLKVSPFFSFYEKETAHDFLKKTMGKNVWNIIWKELFRKKFGKYAENIVAAFIWSRIKKRSAQLGYIEGGFQNFVDFLSTRCEELGVSIRKNCSIKQVEKRRKGFIVNGQIFDKVISTVPTPVMNVITKDLFPHWYLSRLSRLSYLHAVNFIITSKKPLLDIIYWLNIEAQSFPATVIVQHTNFIDKKHYGDEHIIYIGNYTDEKNPFMKMTKNEVLSYFSPHISRISPAFQREIVRSYLFKGPYAQPIFDKTFIKNKPEMETPVKGFLVANLDMTYPHDRGTTYAVKWGREVTKLI